jgi:hypothetical protein
MAYNPIACLVIFGAVALFGIIGLILIDKGVI